MESESFTRRMGQACRATFVQSDVRSLAAFRVGLGASLLADLAMRWTAANSLYGSGWFDRNFVVAINDPLSFSLLWATPGSGWIHLWFGLYAAIYLALLVGWRTRAMTALATIAYVSVVNAGAPALDAGTQMLLSLLVMANFVPLGTAWSVDQGARRAESIVESWGVLALRLQVAWIYWSAALSKSGTTWTAGEALWYVLHFDRMLTPVATAIAPLIGAGAMRIATHGAIAIEFVAPFLLLCPWRRASCRPLGIALLLSLQLGIALTLRTDFQGVMAVALLLFFDSDRWAARDAVVTSPSRSLMRPGFDRLVGAVAIAWLALNALAAAAPWSSAGAVVAAKSALHPMNLTATWDMFAPDVPRADSWWILYGVDDRGTELDLSTGEALSRGKPKGVYEALGRFKHKALERLSLDPGYEGQRYKLVVEAYEDFHRRFPRRVIKEAHWSLIECATPPPSASWGRCDGPTQGVERSLWVYQVPPMHRLIPSALPMLH